jgi:hypothetical protein
MRKRREVILAVVNIVVSRSPALRRRANCNYRKELVSEGFLMISEFGLSVIAKGAPTSQRIGTEANIKATQSTRCFSRECSESIWRPRAGGVQRGGFDEDGVPAPNFRAAPGNTLEGADRPLCSQGDGPAFRSESEDMQSLQSRKLIQTLRLAYAS